MCGFQTASVMRSLPVGHVLLGNLCRILWPSTCLGLREIHQRDSRESVSLSVPGNSSSILGDHAMNTGKHVLQMSPKSPNPLAFEQIEGTFDSARDLVCFSHLRWDFVYQRPQHLMSRFAREGRVFFVEEPLAFIGSPRRDKSSRGATRVAADFR